MPMLSVAALLVVLETPHLQGTPVDVGRKAISGYQIDKSAGLTATLQGPSNWVIEVCGAAKQTSTVSVVRDGQTTAQATVTLGAAKKPNCTGAVAFAVASGPHQYVVTASQPLVVVLTSTTKLLKTHLLGAESALPKAAPPPAPLAVVTPEPASMPVTAAIATPAPTPKHSGPPALRIAVYDLELEGVPRNVGAVVTESVLQEVRKLQGTSAIGMNEIRDMLAHEATKQLAGCSEDSSSCLADLAGALGVDDLVTGKLARIDKSNVLTLRRIDQKRAEVAGVVDKRLEAGSGQEFLAAIGPSIKELYPTRELKPGYVRGVSKDVALRLDPPPVPVWATLTLGGVAAGAAIAGGIVGVLALTSQSAYKDYAALGKTQVISGATLVRKGNEAQTRATVADALFISAGVMAITTAVVALFTDWKGYRNASETQSH